MKCAMMPANLFNTDTGAADARFIQSGAAAPWAAVPLADEADGPGRVAPQVQRLMLSLAAASIAAQQHAPAQRLPFHIQGQWVGSVARAHLATLQHLVTQLGLDQASTQQVRLDVQAGGVQLHGALPSCEAALTQLNAELRNQGLILGWRDERVDVPALGSGRKLLRMERAAARFWGSLTLGAHATGYVPAAQGKPAQVWVAQRADDKATDPGLWDNLIGGGVTAGQSPFEALVREGWEEAGLSADVVRQSRPAARLSLLRDVQAGLQRETLYSHDLALQPAHQPVNQDGEVQRFCLLSLSDAVALAQSGQMTLDAALVMLDFAQRHGVQA